MRNILGNVILVSIICTFALCQKGPAKDKPLVRIGGQTYKQSSLDNFSLMMRTSPIELPPPFPGSRSAIAAMIETQILYTALPFSFSKGTVEKTPEWQWRKRFIPAQIYMGQVTSANMGFPEQELEDYYSSHQDSFKVVIKVGGDTALAKDTLSSDPAKAAAAKAAFAKTGRDSTSYRPFVEVKASIIQTMFSDKYPADPAFIKKTFGDTAHPAVDAVKKEYFYYVRNSDRDFFLRKAYQELYGKPFSDSLKDWYGEGKQITSNDMTVIKGWVPEARRSLYENPQGEKELALWLLRWKVFSEKSARSGFSSRNDVRGALDWAWKIQVVTKYIADDLFPKARKLARIDTAMCRYSFWDNQGSASMPIDPAALATEIRTQTDREAALMFDSLVYTLRIKKGIKFLQTVLKDDKDANPVKLLLQADSLRDTGNVDGAEAIYQKLVGNFPFQMEGRKASIEIAKIQTDRQMYKEAIANYRHYLLWEGRDKSIDCNNFFMIGFIFDEHLNQPEEAQLNYTWILKNAPDCELADDAEFMALHLNEPLTRFEELQGEAFRQGRIVEADSADNATADTSANVKN